MPYIISPFFHQGRHTTHKRYTIFCETYKVTHDIRCVCRPLNATHNILHDTQSDTQYFSRHTIFCEIHEATHNIYHNISPFGLPTQGRYFVLHFLTHRFVYRGKYRVLLCVSRKISCIASCVALDERRARLQMALSGFCNSLKSFCISTCYVCII